MGIGQGHDSNTMLSSAGPSDFLVSALVYEQSCDTLDGRVIEHDRGWQIDLELLLQLSAQFHACETVHAGLHERRVAVHLVASTDHVLDHSNDVALHDLWIRWHEG